MPYFFSAQNLKPGHIVELDGEEARHVLLSHRIKIGEQIKLQGPDGKRFFSEVIKVSKKDLSAKILQEILIASELPVSIALFLSYVSEKVLDMVLQKATELGVARICLFNSQNTAVKLTQEIFQKKAERWNKILAEAAKQSERGQWPNLEFIDKFQTMVKSFGNFDRVYLADLSGRRLKNTGQTFTAVGIVVGPEGGFAQEELKCFHAEKNLETIALSPFVLRAETAAISAISVIAANLV